MAVFREKRRGKHHTERVWGKLLHGDGLFLFVWDASHVAPREYSSLDKELVVLMGGGFLGKRKIVYEGGFVRVNFVLDHGLPIAIVCLTAGSNDFVKLRGVPACLKNTIK